MSKEKCEIEPLRKCPQCKLPIADPQLMRCPRCNSVLQQPVGCEGCKGCGTGCGH